MLQLNITGRAIQKDHIYSSALLEREGISGKTGRCGQWDAQGQGEGGGRWYGLLQAFKQQLCRRKMKKI